MSDETRRTYIVLSHSRPGAAARGGGRRGGRGVEGWGGGRCESALGRSGSARGVAVDAEVEEDEVERHDDGTGKSRAPGLPLLSSHGPWPQRWDTGNRCVWPVCGRCGLDDVTALAK